MMSSLPVQSLPPDLGQGQNSPNLTSQSQQTVISDDNDKHSAAQGSMAVSEKVATVGCSSLTGNGKRITTLSYDPSKPKPPKEEVKVGPPDQPDDLMNSVGFLDEEADEKCQFVCALCNTRFFSHVSLQAHLAMHAIRNERIKLEQEGGDSAWYKSNRLPHLSSRAKGKPHKCPICKRKFHSKVTLNNHKKSHSGNKGDVGCLNCSFCDRPFTHGINLHRHLISVHKVDKNDAGFHCAKALKGAKSFSDQLVAYTGEKEKPYKCSMCNKLFQRLYRAREHTRTHSNQVPFQCSFCSKIFSSSETLSKHIKTLHGDISFMSSAENNALKQEQVPDIQAQSNTIQFADGGSSTVQIQLQHNTYEMNFLNIPRHVGVIEIGSASQSVSACCDKSAVNINSSSNEFSGHHIIPEQPAILDVSPQKGFKCSLCGEMFLSGSLLNKHISTHKIKLQAKCSICQKEFKNEAYMKRHMALHEADRPFKCVFCPKAYYRPYRLANHLRSHTGEKPYQCSVCRKAFAVIENMYKHIKKIHKGEGLQVAAMAVKQIQELNREKMRRIKASM